MPPWYVASLACVRVPCASPTHRDNTERAERTPFHWRLDYVGTLCIFSIIYMASSIKVSGSAQNISRAANAVTVPNGYIYLAYVISDVITKTVSRTICFLHPPSLNTPSQVHSEVTNWKMKYYCSSTGTYVPVLALVWSIEPLAIPLSELSYSQTTHQCRPSRAALTSSKIYRKWYKIYDSFLEHL